jgi:hypothetical protein
MSHVGVFFKYSKFASKRTMLNRRQHNGPFTWLCHWVSQLPDYPWDMPRSRKYNIAELLWPCPHCGHQNTAAEIIRLDNERIQCGNCKQAFVL